MNYAWECEEKVDPVSSKTKSEARPPNSIKFPFLSFKFFLCRGSGECQKSNEDDYDVLLFFSRSFFNQAVFFFLGIFFKCERHFAGKLRYFFSVFSLSSTTACTIDRLVLFGYANSSNRQPCMHVCVCIRASATASLGDSQSGLRIWRGRTAGPRCRRSSPTPGSIGRWLGRHRRPPASG